MNQNRKIIIALIAVAVIVLAGIVALAPTSNQNQTAYTIPLKAQNFGYFEMNVPTGSNFTIKNDHVDVGNGMVFWHNAGNFSNETDGIIISKNYTDNIIPQDMKLVSENNSMKVYMDENVLSNYYKVVKTFNDTDIIVTGNNLNLLEEMVNSTKIKDTSKLTLKNTTNDTQVHKTPIEKVVEKKQVEKKTEPKHEKKIIPKEPIVIGGGSFTTGSGLNDKTYAKIYLGAGNAGETIGIKIFYSRNGTSLNQGNYVTATIDSSGYVSISSADAYSKYPDFASIEVYDSSGKLVSTQGVHLEPRSGTQYF